MLETRAIVPVEEMRPRKLRMLTAVLKKLYTTNHNMILFHGWDHVGFVTEAGGGIAAEIGADVFLVQSAGLTHDLNYIVHRNSRVEEGVPLRRNILTVCGYEPAERDRVEGIVHEAHTRTRGSDLSLEGQALSDADTIVKACPFTPLLSTERFLVETGMSLKELAKKIVLEQTPLMEQGIYFYTAAGKKYQDWAETNLRLWHNVLEAVDDPKLRSLLPRELRRYTG